MTTPIKPQWLPKHTKIVEEHDRKVATGEIKLVEFSTKEELFTYLHSQ